MTGEDILQELERTPFVPLRLHLSSGQKMEIRDSSTAWLRQNTLLIVHPLRVGTKAIGNYDVLSLRLIERVETLGENGKRRARGKKA